MFGSRTWIAAPSALLAACAAPAPLPSPRAPTPTPPAAVEKLEPPTVPGLVVRMPDTLGTADLAQNPMEARAEKQLQTLDSFRVFHDFRFEDRLPDTGITFSSQVVDDAGRSFRLNHYDHGFGILAADVDADGLVDLYFLSQLGSNELWRNLGQGRFVNITEPSGTGMRDQISVGGAFGDIDNDGDPDLYVTTTRHGNRLFRNNGKGAFTDISKESGTDHTGHSSGALFLDFDGDGKLDLYLVNVGEFTTEELGPGGYYIGMRDAILGHLVPARAEPSILYRNLGQNRFEDVSRAVGLEQDEGWAGDAALTDFNDDGAPDLYVVNMQGDDRYLENQGGQRFLDRTAERFPQTPWGTMGVELLDFDNDGLEDLLLTDMHSDMAARVPSDREKLKPALPVQDEYLQGGANNIFGNALWRNHDAGRFEEVSDAMNVETYWPWGTSVGDLNADGFEDIFITASMNYPWRYAVNSLLLNNAGEGFLDSEFVLGVEPRRDGRVEKVWFTLDCSATDKGHPACGSMTGKVSFLGTLGSRSSVIFDLDNDGDLDIVTNDFNSEPMVLVSNLSDRRAVNSLKIRLRGVTSNRDGLGARVKVTAGGKSWVQRNDGKSGYLSHSLLPLYFGLGEEDGIDEVEVRWPSGKLQKVTTGIAPGGLLTIIEG